MLVLLFTLKLTLLWLGVHSLRSKMSDNKATEKAMNVQVRTLFTILIFEILKLVILMLDLAIIIHTLSKLIVEEYDISIWESYEEIGKDFAPILVVSIFGFFILVGFIKCLRNNLRFEQFGLTLLFVLSLINDILFVSSLKFWLTIDHSNGSSFSAFTFGS